MVISHIDQECAAGRCEVAPKLVHNGLMDPDSVDRHAELVDGPREPDGRHLRTAGDLRARLEALPGWHPQSPRHRPDRAAAGTNPAGPLFSGEQAADTATGWEARGGDERDDLSPADIQVIAERQAHIVDGDQTGGGHVMELAGRARPAFRPDGNFAVLGTLAAEFSARGARSTSWRTGCMKSRRGWGPTVRWPC